MTTTDSLLPSAFTPPSDLTLIRGWLDDRTDDIAGLTATTLRRILNDAVAAYALTAAGDPHAIAAIPGQWAEFADGPLARHVGAMYLSGSMTAFTGADAVNRLPQGFLPSWTEQVNDRAVSYMSQATNRLRNVGDDAWRRLRGKLTQGLESGWDGERTMRELRQQVAMSEWRADTIARTETVGAYVNGDRLGAEALGPYGPVEHSWLAAIDARTRPTHASANGQVRRFDQPFDVGGVAMMHPHDGSAPAREIVNCRCVEQHLYAGDARPDGSTVEAPAAQAPAQAWTSQPFVEQHRIQGLTGAGQFTVFDGTRGRALAEMKLVAAYRYKGVTIAFKPSPENLQLILHSAGNFEDILAAVRRTQQHLPQVEAAVDELAEVLTPNQLSQLPSLTIADAPNPSDAMWAERYGQPGFKSAATGGRTGITFYTAPEAGTLRHEAGHVFEQVVQLSDQRLEALSASTRWRSAMTRDAKVNTGQRYDWLDAVRRDGHRPTPDSAAGITGYGQVARVEDLAEAFRLYHLSNLQGALTVDGKTFKQLFPGRYRLITAMLKQADAV